MLKERKSYETVLDTMDYRLLLVQGSKDVGYCIVDRLIRMCQLNVIKYWDVNTMDILYPPRVGTSRSPPPIFAGTELLQENDFRLGNKTGSGGCLLLCIPTKKRRTLD